MRRAALLLLLTLLVGCGSVVDGTPTPAAGALDVLPTEDELTEAVGNRLSTFDFEPFVGGPEIMPDGYRDDADASPFRCIGVTETMLRATYADADVVEAARQSYFTLVEGAEVSGADAAAVRFGSDAAAQDRYRTFVEQWRACDGQTVVKHLRGGTDTDAVIAEVVAEPDLLTATVTTKQGPNASAQRYLRAIALRDATIVEVSLAVARAGRPGVDDPAARAAELMATKVGAHR